MTEPVIRRARPEDAPALAEIGATTFTDTFAHLYAQRDLDHFLAESHSEAYYREKLGDPRYALWVVEGADGALIGYAQAGPCDLPHPEVTDRCGELKRIYFRKGHQGGGLGGRLMQMVFDWLESQGRSRIWIGVWSENHGAQRFYAARGFEKVGEYEFPVGETRDHEFILRRG
jgi:diamine N-acetyltransferase